MTAGATDAVAIRARGVTAHLGGTAVLHGVDLDLPRGRWTSVVGPNGAGKSTLLKALAQLIPHQGTVELLDQPMAKLSARARAQRLAWLGQNESTGDDLRVWDVAMLGRLPHQDWLAAPSAADHQAVEQALRATQAWDWRERALGHLSGGERQRVLLARALAVQADVLLMDEPLANLDPPHQADWLAVVHQLLAQGRTVVSVLHEIAFALHADTMLIIDQGRVLHHGACHDALTHRRLEQVFDQRISIVPVAGQWVVLSRAAAPPPAGTPRDAEGALSGADSFSTGPSAAAP
jgi:iron complex transport system ATP-binding protein